MAVTLSVHKTTPASVELLVQSDDGTGEAYFQRSAAPPGSVDLTSLVPGVLKAYLTRLPNWFALMYNPPDFPARNVMWYVAEPTPGYMSKLPISGFGYAALPIVEGGGDDRTKFRASSDAGMYVFIGLRFIRSNAR